MEAVTRKTATVMFADILGFTEISESLGTEAAYASVSGCLRLLDEVARRHGGAVDKYLGDSLMVLFGGLAAAPHAEAEALAAALEMREELRSYRREVPGGRSLEIQIGINTGFVTIGDVGSSVVREFAVMGDAVNVAARFKSKAGPGGIYFGESTLAAGGEGFTHDEIPPLTLKGKSRPLPAFSLLARRPQAETALRVPRAGDEPALRGRDDVLADLRARCDAALRGSPAACWLHGPAGIGKTRLFAELEEAGVPLLYAAPVPIEEASAFRSFRRLIDFGPLAGQGEPAVAALVDGLIGAARERPLVLVFDEIRRTDADSHAALAALTRRLAAEPDLPLLLLFGSRAEPPGDFEVESLALAPIEEGPARALLEESSAADPLTPEAAALVVARAGGNPAALLRGRFLADALRADAERSSETSDRSAEAERRRATVLFADLSGFTAMSERTEPALAYEIVTDCLARLGAVATRYGGTVEKHLGDCVLALFGVPRAIEDAPRAAINAALEMRTVVERFNEERDLDAPLSIHTGIETGIGISADISGPLIREFALMGDSVNVANALTDEAESWEVYVGAGTHASARDTFAFEPRPAVERKHGAAIEAFELVSSEVQLHRERPRGRRIFSALVGRETELELARAAVSGAAAGTGSLLRIVAEAGLGKSRLLEELRHGESAPVRWLDARALSNGSALRYHPFADLLLQWLGLSSDEEDRVVALALDSALAHLMGEEALAVRPSFRMVLGLGDEDATAGDAMSKVLLNHFTRWLRALASEQPTALVFEDLHWADLSSIELLEPLLRLAATHPVLFVLLYRPGYEETSGRVAAHAESALEAPAELRLQPLDREGARELIRNLFRGADVPHRIRSSLADRAAGNPFFLEEAIRSLLDEGALEQRGDELVATERIHEAEIPGTIQEVIMARVDRLELRKREFLQVASVMGVNFYLRIVEEVLGKEDSHDLTNELIEAELLTHADALSGLELAFKHPLIQEVTYDSMLEDRRRERHREVGRAIEGCLSANAPGYHAMLAFHYGRGDSAEEAEPHLFAAGEEAARSAASNEALQFFREASDLYLSLHGDAGDPAKLATLEGNLALALMNRGQLGESIDHFDRSLSLRGAGVPGSLPGFVLRLLRDLPVVMSRIYLGSGTKGGAPADEEERTRFDLMFRRAMAQSTTDATRFVMDSMSMLRRLGGLDPLTVPDAAALYAGAISIFSYGAGLFGVGERILHLADELAERGAVHERELYYRLLRFLHYFWAGDWSEEHRLEEPLIEQGLASGRLWEVSTYMDIDTDRGLRRGEFAAAEARLQDLTEVADLYQHDLAWSAVHAHRTFIAVERRQLDHAAAYADSYYEEHGDVPLNLYALGERAKIETLQGRLEDAERTLARCERLMKIGGTAAFHRITYARSRLLYDVTRLEGAHESGDRSEFQRLRRATAKSVHFATSTSASIASRRPEVYRLAGRAAWLMGRAGRAGRWWRRSLDSAHVMGARPEEARLLAEVGLRTGARSEPTPIFEGRAPDALRAEAARLFGEMDLEADALRLEAGRTP